MYLKCTGTSGTANLQASPIDQVRNFTPPRKRISCETTLDNVRDYVKGDPGSVFNFQCPKDCAIGGSIVGTGL